MQAAVQMLKSEAIQAIWQLYCRQDPVVTITVRKIYDPSPDSSRAPSYSKALSQRRSASGNLTVPDIPVHTPPRNVSARLDPVSLELIADLPENEKVVILPDDGDAQAVSKEYLLCWINSQLQDRKLLTDINVQTLDDDGVFQSTPLTRGVWERSLIRGQWKQDFAPLWEKHIVATHDRHSTIAQLCEINPNFTQACINFIHDLRTFGGNKGSRARLEGTGHEFYLGRPYFDNATVNAIMSLKTIGGSVEQQLRVLAEKRIGGEICASHDLSPFFESVLGLSWDKERSTALSTQHTMAKAKISSEGSKIKKLAHKSSKLFSDTFGRKKGGGRGGGSSGGDSSEAAKA